jgi:hypothetical protein
MFNRDKSKNESKKFDLRQAVFEISARDRADALKDAARKGAPVNGVARDDLYAQSQRR